MRIFVGNLPWAKTDKDVQELFEIHGPVKSCKVITDRETGKSRGFGFVEIADDAQAREVIDALKGYNWDGRELIVDEAKSRPKPL